MKKEDVLKDLALFCEWVENATDEEFEKAEKESGILRYETKEENKMDAVTYLKEKKRLTENCGIVCENCRLELRIDDKLLDCDEVEYQFPEKAVEIIEQWSKERPQETYKSLLLKAFPKANIDMVTNMLYPSSIFGKINCDKSCFGVGCWDCPVKE